MTTLSEREAAGMGLLALVGLLVPNGIFLYYAITEPELVTQAMRNPVAAVFIMEAMLLMLLGGWLLGKLTVARPSGLMFIVMSLAGSLAFSVPATMWMVLGRSRSSLDRGGAMHDPDEDSGT